MFDQRLILNIIDYSSFSGTYNQIPQLPLGQNIRVIISQDEANVTHTWPMLTIAGAMAVGCSLWSRWGSLAMNIGDRCRYLGICGRKEME